MLEAKITFINHSTIKVQAQIYTGRTLVSTCVADPGESHTLQATSARHDIYFKNGATGREVARQLNSEAKAFTLIQDKRKFTIFETKEDGPPDLFVKTKLAVTHSTK